MYVEVETHCHTVASGHAYNTIEELAKYAKEKGLKAICIADHGPKMPGSAHIFYFYNMVVIPKKINDIIIFKGCEANIIDYDGNLDIDNNLAKRLDFVIASMHDVCVQSGTKSDHTSAIIGALKNPYVHCIGHPGNPIFEIDKTEVVKMAKEYKKAIEINNSSFYVREKSKENCFEILKLCKEEGVYIALGSDAHHGEDLGNTVYTLKMLKEINFPDELIINKTLDSFVSYLKLHGKEICL